MPGYFISFNDEGTPNDEIKSKIKDKFSQLEIQLIAYGPGIQPEKDDNTIETSNEASPPSYWAASAAGSTSPTSNRQSQIGDNANSHSS
jgi:hypothetical protein